MGIIQTRNLTKRFKDLLAVDNINLEIEEGECFGLLGPNGAGKTSLIKMITAVSSPASGDITVMGMDIKTHSRQIKACLGVVPQMDNLDPDLTVFKNLITFARYFNISGSDAHRISMEVLNLFELQGKLNSRIEELSGGMKRRLLIARGLINQPRILVLDEPSIGLDPQAKHLVWHKLAELKSQGVTQLISTQNMDEAAVLCDRVAIMHHGRILSLDTPEGLVSQHVGSEVGEIEMEASERERIIKILADRGVDFEDTAVMIHLFHLDSVDFSLDGDLDARLKRRPGTLEDVFLRLTGRSLLE